MTVTYLAHMQCRLSSPPVSVSIPLAASSAVPVPASIPPSVPFSAPVPISVTISCPFPIAISPSFSLPIGVTMLVDFHLCVSDRCFLYRAERRAPLCIPLSLWGTQKSCEVLKLLGVPCWSLQLSPRCWLFACLTFVCCLLLQSGHFKI